MDTNIKQHIYDVHFVKNYLLFCYDMIQFDMCLKLRMYFSCDRISNPIRIGQNV